MLGRIASAVRNRYDQWRDASLDRRFGIQTTGIIDDMNELGIPDSDARSSSGYEPIQLEVFDAILGALRDREVEPAQYCFVDLGSGLGRALILAAEAGFRRAIGVELSAPLCHKASHNVASYRRKQPGGAEITVVNDNAANVRLPDENVFLFLYNPFDEIVLAKVVAKILSWNEDGSRSLYVAYRNPVHADILAKCDKLERLVTNSTFELYHWR